ncbi:MAG TPA: GTPase HflX, partial [Woeseiaceae bacterium]|nr:GTPase HflX [Woeseiaceae bacterium]
MFERPQSGEKAILLHASPGGTPDLNEREEFAELAASAGAVIVDQLVSARRRPDSRFFIGKGKLDDVQKSVERHGAELVI